VRSTFAFYKSILPATQLQEIDDNTLMKDILWVYKKLILKYEIDKTKISSKNLIEIKYADLVNKPAKEIENIYKNILNDDYNRISPYVNKYLKGLNHSLKKYEYTSEFLATVNEELLEIIELKKYDILH
jgi:hypothetical protein